MRWMVVACTLILAACNVTHEAADGSTDQDGGGLGDGGGGCDATYCCSSAADIPKGLICGVCHHDYSYGVVCEEGAVACDPRIKDDSTAQIDGYQVLTQEAFATGDGGCVAGGLERPDGGGCEYGCTDPDVVAHVEGQDDCYKFDFTADNTTAYYGKQVEFTLTLTNGCSTPIDLRSARAWLTIHLYTHGVACCPSRESLPAGQNVATLPMDGWDGMEYHQTLQPNQSISKTLPWHPDADGMVNPKDAPEGLYDVYAMPPAIVRDAGDWREPLSKFLVVRVVKQ